MFIGGYIVWKWDQQGWSTFTTLTDKLWSFFVKFSEQLNKPKIFNDEFYFWNIFKTMIFLKKKFLSHKNIVCCVFPWFSFWSEFLWFFCVFHIAENLPLL